VSFPSHLYSSIIKAKQRSGADRRNAYYFWNKKTNVTTWDNPLVGANASASASAGTTSNTSKSDNDEGSKDQQGEEEDEGPGNNDGADPAVKKAAVKAPAVASAASSSSKPDPSAADYGGIDPELAYLDPTLSTGRKGQSASGSYAARFNARTGRFEGDPTKNPDRVGDVERAKRQNQFYFDYDSWQKTLAVVSPTAASRASEEESRSFSWPYRCHTGQRIPRS
jgi:hypothetical protein